MNTSYRVTDAAGNILGIFPKGQMDGVKALLDTIPGARVKAVVTVTAPCATHSAYEADNCPACGTGVTIR